MLSGRQLIKLTTIKDRYEPVLYIELSDLKLEFPEVQAKKIILPEIQKDPVSIWCTKIDVFFSAYIIM